MKYTVVTSLEAFVEIGDELEDNLSGFIDSFFFSPLWLVPFQDVLTEAMSVLHVIGRDEHERLRGAMHLAAVKTRFLRILHPEIIALLGTRSVVSPEHLELPIDNEDCGEWFTFFKDQICTRFRRNPLIILDSVSDQAKNVAGLADFMAKAGYRVIRQEQDRCPYLVLPDSFEELLNSYSSKKRKAIRRELRHSDAMCRLVDFDHLGSVDQALDIARRLHHLSRRVKGESGSFERPGYLEFHRRLANELAKKQGLYFKFLLRDETPIAFLYGFLNGDRFYDYQTGYDPEHSDIRPGFLILALAIRDLIGRKVGRFDFLRGHEEYKLYWTETVRKTYRYYIFPPGVKSWIYYALIKLYRGWR